MLERKLFVEEASQEAKKLERTLNVVFLDIDGVIYVSGTDDRDHCQRELWQNKWSKNFPYFTAIKSYHVTDR